MNRTWHALVGIVLLVGLALPPAAGAANPAPLGGALTLADGSVLPSMPADLLTPSAQAEMLAAHGDAQTAAGIPDAKAAPGPSPHSPVRRRRSADRAARSRTGSGTRSSASCRTGTSMPP